MKLTPKETIKIENFKAQYNSILGNISSANKELEGIIAKAITSRLELTALAIEKADKDLEMSQMIEHYDTSMSMLSRKEETLNERKEKLDNREKNIGKKEIKAIDIANGILVDIDENVRESKSVLTKTMIECQELNREIVDAEERLDEVLPKVIYQTNKLNRKTKTLVNVIEDIEELEDEIE